MASAMRIVQATGDIITVAGNGVGDGGPATAAFLSNPRNVAVDAAGDIFIADTANSRIREVVKATGDMITVAGNGSWGSSGDGGPATAASLDDPEGLAVDAAGDILISDAGHGLIREVVQSTGDIIAVADASTPTGVAVDAAGDMLFADMADNVVHEAISALTITPAPLTVTADSCSMAYGAAIPEFDGTLTGVVDGDAITVTYQTLATAASDAGTYAITPVLSDPGGRLANYTVTCTSGTLTINPVTPA